MIALQVVAISVQLDNCYCMYSKRKKFQSKFFQSKILLKTSPGNIKQYANALKFKSFFLLSLFVGLTIVSCVRTEKDMFERVLSCDRNLVNTKDAELVCHLSEDNILLKDIVDFTVIDDSSFVVVDRNGAYLYHISGYLKKQLGNRGQAEGEMISPSLVYSTSDYVYIWCTSLMKLLVFDHEANFKYELSGFKRSVKKFIVNSSDEILYLYTSGFLNDSENKVYDVVDVFNIAEKSSKQYGERGPEDEILSTYINSGGLYVDTDQLIYLHPGHLIINILDLNSQKSVRYKIDDKAFYTTEITSHIRDVMGDRIKLTDYLYNNSLVKGLYKDNDQFIIVSEIGQYDFNMQTRIMNTRKRKVKLYLLDSSFNPKFTILYDYIKSPNIVIYSGAMYFLSLNLNGEDQIVTLNKFSFSDD